MKKEKLKKKNIIYDSKITMEVTMDIFLEDENKKVTILKVVPEIDKQDFALQKLILAVNNYMKDKPRSIYYNKIVTHFMIIVIEGINS